MEDPLSRPQFGGDEAELRDIHSYQRGIRELQKKPAHLIGGDEGGGAQEGGKGSSKKKPWWQKQKEHAAAAAGVEKA